jgi:hypothetical protein
MKNRILTGVLYIISGLLIAAGPQTIFKVCAVKDMAMKCHWSARALIAAGGIVFIGGILYLPADLITVRLNITLLVLAAYISAILIPSVLIGGCENKRMLCQSLTFPSCRGRISLPILIFWIIC